MGELLYYWKHYHWRTCNKCGQEEVYGHYDDNKNNWLGCVHCYIAEHKEKLSDDEWRRLNYLLSLRDYLPNRIVQERLVDKRNYGWMNKELRQGKEAHALFDKLEMTEELRFSYWYIIRQMREHQHAEYKKKPIRVRKDNKDVINHGGSRHSGFRRVRYPKKGRRTAWKRFYKLFPSLDPKNKKS